MRPTGEFRPIPSQKEDLQWLEQQLTQHVPRAHPMLNICKFMLEDRLPADVIQTQFYHYVDGHDDDATTTREPFVLCIQRPNTIGKNAVIIVPPKNPTSEMIQALNDFIDWSVPIVFELIPFDFWESHLKPLCQSHGDDLSGRHVKFGLWIMGKEEASKIKIASTGTLEKNGVIEEYNIRFLEEADIAHIVKNWSYAHDESEGQIKKLLGTLPSCGLFVKGADGGEELASSMLGSPFGSCNTLYTEAKHRGKGYALLVLQWIAKQVGVKFGLDVVVETEDTNMGATTCLKRCGFQKFHHMYWQWYTGENGAQQS